MNDWEDNALKVVEQGSGKSSWEGICRASSLLL